METRCTRAIAGYTLYPGASCLSDSEASCRCPREAKRVGERNRKYRDIAVSK